VGEGICDSVCPCLTTGGIWDFLQIVLLLFYLLQGLFVCAMAAETTHVWDELPAEGSTDALYDVATDQRWQDIFREMKEGMAPNSAHGVYGQLILVAFINLLQTVLLLRDLRWHDGVAILSSTLGYAAKDLQDVLVVTAMLLSAFASFGVAMFGSFGAQDIFVTWGSASPGGPHCHLTPDITGCHWLSFVRDLYSNLAVHIAIIVCQNDRAAPRPGDAFQTLALLGFGKNVGYDTLVNDQIGPRFDGLGMGNFAMVKPIMFWVLLFLLVFIIPNVSANCNSISCAASERALRALPRPWYTTVASEPVTIVCLPAGARADHPGRDRRRLRAARRRRQPARQGHPAPAAPPPALRRGLAAPRPALLAQGPEGHRVGPTAVSAHSPERVLSIYSKC
jgi:hypothetical protein